MGKIIAAGAVLTLLTAALAGCGGGAASAPAASGQQPDNKDQGAKQDGKNDVTEITVWEMYGEKVQIPQIIDEFNKTHPSIKVKDQNFPDHTALLQKVQIASTSNGAKPDAILYDMINVPITNQLLPLVDLNKFIANDKDFDINDFYPAFREFGHIGGKQLSLHGYSNNLMLFYNKKLFKDAGLDPEKPPQTWDELLDTARKLTKPGQWGYQIGGINDTYFESLSWEYQTMVWQNGGEVWNKDFTAPAFNSPQGAEALQFLVDLVNKYKVSPLNAPQKGFQNGKVAMMLDGSWSIKDNEDALKENLGAAYLPKKSQFATNVGGEEWMLVQSNDKKERAAWEFMKYMLSKDVQIRISKLSGDLPTRKSVMESPEFQDYLKQHPAYAVSAKEMEYGKYRAPITQYLQASEVLYKYLQQTVYNKITPQDALTKASNDITNILATKK